LRIANAPDSVAIADEGRGWLSIDLRYTASECCDGTFVPSSDIFGFGLILVQLLVGLSAFLEGREEYEIV
jgi:hypothetical protein